ncbi:MAG: dihydrofolate reductase [Bdellovibrionales bacterium]
MKVIQIAAMASNRVIGNKNDLPWRIPEDFKFFKDKTMGKLLIMGRKTYESIPETGLPNRHIVVVTRNANYKVDDQSVVKPNIDEAIKYAESQKEKYGDEIWIAGGGEIYKQTLDMTETLYLTVIEKAYEGDAYFPEFNKEEFDLVEENPRTSPENFTFFTYKRKN